MLRHRVAQRVHRLLYLGFAMAFDDLEKDVLFIFKVPVYDALCDAEAVSDLRKRRIGEPLFYKKIQRALHYPLSRIFRRFFRPAQKVFLLTPL
ncbi:hypothetical protein SDC9_73947 [bioreactor metagenome]|uniref:Uncharacterized protein n=1 Tax=bioreactor metagenome TaxID=1076179 RepID=A0A644YG05_9ZZZZ